MNNEYTIKTNSGDNCQQASSGVPQEPGCFLGEDQWFYEVASCSKVYKKSGLSVLRLERREENIENNGADSFALRLQIVSTFRYTYPIYGICSHGSSQCAREHCNQEFRYCKYSKKMIIEVRRIVYVH